MVHMIYGTIILILESIIIPFYFSANTLKFWQPQLLQAINDYKYLNNGSSSNMCNMLDVIIPKNTSVVSTECTVVRII